MLVARRADRSSDTWLKRVTAGAFYRAHNAMSDIQIPNNVGDFRLMDRAVVDVLNALPESRRFMKGLFAWVGFRTAAVDYVRESRVAGTSSFNGWRLWNLAVEGITGFSITPLRIWTYLGLAVAAVSLAWWRGTDVAREAASIVLLDDDFGSIVRAIRLGRRIYDNLRKAVAFILAVHLPIAGLALAPLLWPVPALPRIGITGFWRSTATCGRCILRWYGKRSDRSRTSVAAPKETSAPTS